MVAKKQKKTPAKGRAKPKSRQAQNRGLMEGAGAWVDDITGKAVSALINYTIVAGVAAAIIFVLMLFAGGYFFNIGDHIDRFARGSAKSMGFEVTRITLKGRTDAEKNAIMDALYDERFGEVIGRSLLHYDAHKARARLEEIGWVRDAAVSRLWPNTLHVSIRERDPVAVWQRGGGLYLVDMSGAVITEIAGHQYSDLPVILNADDPSSARPIMEMLAANPQISDRIFSLKQFGGRRWDINFQNGYHVKLPERHVEKAIERVVKLESMPQPMSEGAEYLDLRNEKSAFYKQR